MKSPFSRIILVIGICIVSFVIYGMGYSALSAKSSEVAGLESAIAAKTETVNRIAATRATLAGISNDEAVVQGYFVPESGVVAFIDSLQTHGKALGATINVLSVSTAGTPAQSSLTFSLTVTGTFDAVLRTIGSIEYAPYDLSVSSLDVAQDAKDAWHADLKLLVGSKAASTATTTP